ncbi:MAG: hypothetical protein IKW74_02830 [Thermoguttaceae bacterium]|nr:hypothetical protein [Thermoguttaceae bacterium]
MVPDTLRFVPDPSATFCLLPNNEAKRGAVLNKLPPFRVDPTTFPEWRDSVF